MVLQGIGLGILLLSKDPVVMWTAIVIFGLGMGGVGALTPLVIFDMFGLRKFGSIMGLSTIAIAIPIVLGPYMAGRIFDTTGKYDLMFTITIVLLVISIVCFAVARVPRERVCAQVEKERD